MIPEQLADSQETLRLALGDIWNATNDAGQAAHDVMAAGGDSQAALAALTQIRAIVAPILEGTTPAE